MSDSMDISSPSDTATTDDNIFFLFFLLLFVALCFTYCCRDETPANDPANDRIAGYIPNPSSRPTPSLEERRQEIEDNLIVRQVVAAAPAAPAKEQPEEAEAQSEDPSKKRPILERLAKSDRTYASYASALKRITSKRKLVEFSEPKHSASLPPSFSPPSAAVPATTTTTGDETQPQDDTVPRQDTSTTAAITTTTQPNNQDDKDEGTPPDHDHHDHAAVCSIKHRRKADIMVRTLARVLSKNQDYDQPTTCDICLLDYEVGEEVAWSNNEGCIHAFHKECITDWLLRNPKCPLCRRDYIVAGGGGADGNDNEV